MTTMLLMVVGIGFGLGLALIAAGVWGLVCQQLPAEEPTLGETDLAGDEPVLPEPVLAGALELQPAVGSGSKGAAGEVDTAAALGTGDRLEDGTESMTAPRSRVWVRLLGPVRVLVDGVEVTVPARRLELLCYLVLHPDGVSQPRVADALWPEVQPGRLWPEVQPGRETEWFANTLRRLRGDLRRAANDPALGIIEYAGGRYRVDRSVVDADVWQLRVALQAARQAAGVVEQRRWLARVAALWQGQLAEGAYSWAEPIDRSLRDEVVAALTWLAELHEQAADLRGAGVVLGQALEVDPIAEGCVQQSMRVQARLGSSDAVRRSFRRLEAGLADLGEVPNAATRRLRDELIAACATELPTVHR